MLLPPRKPPSWGVQLWDLFLIQLSNYRWSWRRMAITGMLLPTANIIMLGLFARDSGATTLSYILIGNIALSLMFENMGKVSSNFAYMKMVGTITYFATLPIHRYALVVATLGAFGLLSMPALIVTILFGSFYLHVPLAPHPLLLLVIPLTMLPLASLGALIGNATRHPDEANGLNLVVTFTLLALGPVLIPPDHLPLFLHTLGRFSPATYAASAIRQTLLGPITSQLLWDLGMLLLFTVLMAYVVGRRLEWRNE